MKSRNFNCFYDFK